MGVVQVGSVSDGIPCQEFWEAESCQMARNRSQCHKPLEGSRTRLGCGYIGNGLSLMIGPGTRPGEMEKRVISMGRGRGAFSYDCVDSWGQEMGKNPSRPLSGMNGQGCGCSSTNP